MMFNFKKYKNSPVFLDNNETLTYNLLEEECKNIGSIINKKSLVLCLLDNSIGGLVGYLSFLNNNHVPLLLSSNLDNGLIDNLVNIYQPEWIWLPQALNDSFNIADIKFLNRGYNLVRTKYNSTYKLNPDLALLLPTSGSTGSPKLVRHSYKNLKTNIDSITDYLKMDSSRRGITSLPVHYTYGLSVVHTHLWKGASIVISNESVTQQSFWDLFNKYEVTSLSGVPYTWDMLVRMGITKKKLSSLKYCDQAGGKLPPALQDSLIKWAKDTSREFIVMYGQTEASPRMGYLPWEYAQEKKGSMGIAIPGGNFRLINNENETPKVGEIGELIYEGPNVTLGYASNGADLQKGDDFKGVLHTGDMAIRDKDGFYTIVGRKKRFLKIFGNRVNLDDVERIIKHEYPLIDCACVGKENSMTILIKGDMDNDIIRNFISQKTKLNSIAFNVKNVDSIPRSESGKIRYSEIL